MSFCALMKGLMVILLWRCVWSDRNVTTRDFSWCDRRILKNSDVLAILRLRDQSWCERTGKSCVQVIEDDMRCNITISSQKCESGMDECFCGDRFRGYHIDVDTQTYKFCFRCLNDPTKVIALTQLCDGVIDCPDLSDECLCIEKPTDYICKNVNWRVRSTTSKDFHCPSRIGSNNLTLQNVCDGMLDCAGGDDEKHCRIQGSKIFEKSHGQIHCKGDTENDPRIYSLGGYGRYYKFQECDEIPHCASSSDECLPKCYEKSFFSDEESLISKTKFGVLLSISGVIGIFAVIGNSFAIVFTCWKLRSKRRSNSTKVMMNMLYLSLSISDIMVAIYTTMVWSKAHSKELGSRYCKYDNIWRSSAECSFLGCLFVIGSEQSVFTLVLITLTRVSAVRRPHAKPAVRGILAGLAVCWIISIFLATIPLTPHLEDVFVRRILRLSEDDFILRSIKASEVEDLTYLLLMGSKNSTFGESAGQIGSWSRLRYLMKKKLNMSSSGALQFGYYSSHSVCLPTLFPKRTERAWPYSFSILLMNFLAFTSMILGYFLIYREKKLSEANVGRHCGDGGVVSIKIKTKIILILVTDLLCWLPVCILGFAASAGHAVDRNVYLVAAFVVLPINSAVNPFLYTMPFKYIRKAIRLTIQCQRKNSPDGLHESYRDS